MIAPLEERAEHERLKTQLLDRPNEEHAEMYPQIVRTVFSHVPLTPRTKSRLSVTPDAGNQVETSDVYIVPRRCVRLS